jgi:hypothetical protein
MPGGLPLLSFCTVLALQRHGTPDRGLVDFLLQEEVECRPYSGNGGQLTDFGPSGRDRSAQNVGAKLKFQGEGEPTAKPQSHFLLGFV